MTNVPQKLPADRQIRGHCAGGSHGLNGLRRPRRAVSNRRSVRAGDDPVVQFRGHANPDSDPCEHLSPAQAEAEAEAEQ